MNNDLGDQPKPTQSEGQPKERVIEVNEWFTPFEDYDSIPYREGASKDVRQKIAPFVVANVGDVSFLLSWKQKRIETARAFQDYGVESPWKTLLATPLNEQIVSMTKLHEEQRKMEARIGQLYVHKEELLQDQKPLPFAVEIELPSGNIISHQIDNHEADWSDQTGASFQNPSFPEIPNLLSKLQARIVPME